MGKKEPGQEGECGQDDNNIIQRRGVPSHVLEYDVPDEKKRGQRQKEECHPIGPCVGQLRPRPFQAGFFPQYDMPGKTYGDSEQADVKDISKYRVNGFSGCGPVKGDKKPQENHKDVTPLGQNILPAFYYRRGKEDEPPQNPDQKDAKCNL